MYISHWGLFPGWFECVPEPNGSVRISGGPIAWRAVNFDDFCAAVQAAEAWIGFNNALSA